MKTRQGTRNMGHHSHSRMLRGQFGESRKLLHDMLLKQGLSGEDIIREIHKQIYSLDITEQAKIAVFLSFSNGLLVTVNSNKRYTFPIENMGYLSSDSSETAENKMSF